METAKKRKAHVLIFSFYFSITYVFFQTWNSCQNMLLKRCLLLTKFWVDAARRILA